jgi:AcrR family transcriptional regulator
MARTVKQLKKIKNKGWLRRHANIDTKREILNVAGSLFARQGYEKTSVVDIANSVGIKDASIYNHFKSKQEILYEFVRQVLIDLVDDCEKTMATTRDLGPKEKLRVFVEAHTGFLVNNLEVTPIVDAYTYRTVKLLSEEQSRELVKLERSIFLMLRTILQEGIEQKAFKIDDLTVTLFAILGSIEHLVYWYRSGGRLSKASIQTKLSNLALVTVQAT